MVNEGMVLQRREQSPVVAALLAALAPLVQAVAAQRRERSPAVPTLLAALALAMLAAPLPPLAEAARQLRKNLMGALHGPAPEAGPIEVWKGPPSLEGRPARGSSADPSHTCKSPARPPSSPLDSPLEHLLRLRLQTWKTLRAARWMRRRRERSPAAVCSSRDHLQLLAG